MSNNNQGNGTAQWNSRFGYIMVAAGAAIGLGNIWKFPYLAYRGGGGIFLIVYIIIIAIMAHPMVEMETAIGRHSKSDTVTAFEKINKNWGFVGWMANLCTLMINMYYVVVGGWVLKYAFTYIVSGDFGEDKGAFFTDFTGSTVEPIVWTVFIAGLRINSFVIRYYEYSRKSYESYDAFVVCILDCMWYMGVDDRSQGY